MQLGQTPNPVPESVFPGGYKRIIFLLKGIHSAHDLLPQGCDIGLDRKLYFRTKIRKCQFTKILVIH